MINESLKKKIVPTLIVIFLSLLTLKNVVGMGVPSIAFTVVWVLLILIADYDTSAAFTLGVVICFASVSATIPAAFFILWTIVNHYKKFKLHAIFWISCGVALIEFFRFLLVPNESFRTYVSTAVVLLLVVTLITGLYNKFFDPIKCIKTFIGFYFFLTIDIVLVTAKALGGIGQIVSSRFRIGQIDSGDQNLVGLLEVNSNAIALLSILAIAFALILMNKKHMKLWAVVGITVYATVIGLLTVSKTFVLVYAGFWAIFLLWFVWKNGGNIFKPLALILIVVIAIVLLSKTSIAQNVIYRFETESDLTTGRLELWKQYWDYMLNSGYTALFGIGLQEILIKTGFETVPHNAIMETFLCLGFAGILLFSVFFVFFIRMGIDFIRNSHDTKHPFILFLPLLTYIVFIQGLQFLRINYIYALLALVFASMVTLSPKEDSTESKQGKDLT